LLSGKQQRTIRLMYFEGLTAEEAAIQTGDSPSVVRHNYYRGLSKLKKLVNAKNMKRSSEI
jgi:RNA polymerase sigma-70 factor, ECF subfamily